MQRPHDVTPIANNDTQGASEAFEPEYGTLEQFGPGSHGRWRFTVTVPSSYRPGMQLYVMGYVLGKGFRETRYTTLFARRYDLRKRRFVSVENNDDYAHYE